VLLISYLYVPESRADENEKRLDWTGAALATLGLGAVVYGLIESSRQGFRNPLVATATGGGALSLAMFVVFEMRTPTPMLHLGLFRSRNFSGANLLTLFLYTPLSGSMFFVPLNLIQVQGFSATAAGAAWLPFILIIFLLSRWSGGLVERFGAKLPLMVGPVITAIGYGLFTLTGVGEHFWSGFFPAIAVLGLGMAISIAPLTATVMGAVPVTHAGVASGVNNAISRIAGLLGVAIFGIVMQHAFSSELDRRLVQLPVAPEVRSYVYRQRARLAVADAPEGVDPSTRSTIKASINESFIHGFHVVTVTAMFLSLAAAVSALMMIEGKPAHSKSRLNASLRTTAKG